MNTDGEGAIPPGEDRRAPDACVRPNVVAAVPVTLLM